MKFRPETVAVTQARTASLLNAALPSLTSFTRIRELFSVDDEQEMSKVTKPSLPNGGKHFVFKSLDLAKPKSGTLD